MTSGPHDSDAQGTEDPVAGSGGEVPPEPAEAADSSVPEQAPESADEGTPQEGPDLQQQLAERTADLQRLQAEYVNYRRRVERDRAQAKAQGEVAVLRSLLTVLDDIGRAEEHGQLEGGFKAVAEALQQALRSHRLEAFGEPGDAFDPRLHEALFHGGESADVETTSVHSVVRTGYRVGDEVVRHAQVGVVEPAAQAAETTEHDEAAGTGADE